MDDACVCMKLHGPGLHPSCFGQFWLFEGTSPEALSEIASQFLRRQLAAGEDLFRQGEPAESMYLLKQGLVKLWRISPEGRVVTLAIRKSGDFLGEAVLIETGEYPVTATCLEPTLACGMDRGNFEALVTKYPPLALAVIRNLSRQIQHLSSNLDALAEPTLGDRLYKLLANVAQEVGTRVPGGWTIAHPLTHEEIAFLVGAHRVSVTRTLGKLRSGGKIRISGKILFVSDASEE